MKIQELIEELKKFNPETEVMILDGFGGGGVPREINLGPQEHYLRMKDYLNSDDVEGFDLHTPIVVMGYGCD